MKMFDATSKRMVFMQKDRAGLGPAQTQPVSLILFGCAAYP